MPDVTYAVLTYRTGGIVNFSVAASRVTGLNLQLSQNDPYDPDSVVGNASAQGFDFFRDYYRNYIVTRSKIIVHFQSVDNGPWFAYVLPQTGPNVAAIVAGSPQQFLMNLPYIKYKKVMPPGASNQTVKIVNTWSINRDTGGANRSNFWEGSNYAALTSGSPGTPRNWYIFGSTFADGEAGQVNCLRFQATVIYYTKFYGRKLTPENDDPE